MKAINMFDDIIRIVEYEIVSEDKVEILNYSVSDSRTIVQEEKLPICSFMGSAQRITHLWVTPYRCPNCFGFPCTGSTLYLIINPESLLHFVTKMGYKVK